MRYRFYARVCRTVDRTDPRSLIGNDGRKKSDMTITLDNDNCTYTAGDTIKGHVLITLTQDVAVKGQFLTCMPLRTPWILYGHH